MINWEWIMKALRTALLSIALGACLSSGALAQSTGSSGQNFGYGSGQMRSPCTEDYAKFCSQVSRYGMRQCLLDHQPDFSPACKSQRKAEAEAAAHRPGG
jgi:hypothetical protein